MWASAAEPVESAESWLEEEEEKDLVVVFVSLSNDEDDEHCYKKKKQQLCFPFFILPMFFTINIQTFCCFIFRSADLSEFDLAVKESHDRVLQQRISCRDGE